MVAVGDEGNYLRVIYLRDGPQSRSIPLRAFRATVNAFAGGTFFLETVHRGSRNNFGIFI